MCSRLEHTRWLFVKRVTFTSVDRKLHSITQVSFRGRTFEEGGRSQWIPEVASGEKYVALVEW